MSIKNPMGFQRWENRKRNRASGIIARAFRRNRFRLRRRRRRMGGFSKRVNRVVLSKQQIQYHLVAENSVSVTDSPIVLADLSSLPYDHDNPNAKWARTCPKVMLYNWSIDFNLDASINTGLSHIVISLIRHKRSERLSTSDLRSSVTVTAPAIDAENTPFLNCATAPNSFSIAEAQANPFFLSSMYNPKVIEVVKTWKTTLQSFLQLRNSHNGTPDGSSTDPADQYASVMPSNTYPKDKSFSYFKKMGKTMKYPVSDASDLTAPFPSTYNNSNYYLIAYSGHPSANPNPPQIGYAIRTAFRDID